jgi:hypothetical protein
MRVVMIDGILLLYLDDGSIAWIVPVGGGGGSN